MNLPPDPHIDGPEIRQLMARWENLTLEVFGRERHVLVIGSVLLSDGSPLGLNANHFPQCPCCILKLFSVLNARVSVLFSEACRNAGIGPSEYLQMAQRLVEQTAFLAHNESKANSISRTHHIVKDPPHATNPPPTGGPDVGTPADGDKGGPK